MCNWFWFWLCCVVRVADGCRSHIFYSQRVVEISDGKPKWSGMDEASQLLDDKGGPVK